MSGRQGEGLSIDTLNRVMVVLRYHIGGKKKPLKQPKKAQADVDDVSLCI